MLEDIQHTGQPESNLVTHSFDVLPDGQANGYHGACYENGPPFYSCRVARTPFAPGVNSSRLRP
jgi:hypothetical protein